MRIKTDTLRRTNARRSVRSGGSRSQGHARGRSRARPTEQQASPGRRCRRRAASHRRLAPARGVSGRKSDHSNGRACSRRRQEGQYGSGSSLPSSRPRTRLHARSRSSRSRLGRPRDDPSGGRRDRRRDGHRGGHCNPTRRDRGGSRHPRAHVRPTPRAHATHSTRRARCRSHAPATCRQPPAKAGGTEA